MKYILFAILIGFLTLINYGAYLRVNACVPNAEISQKALLTFAWPIMFGVEATGGNVTCEGIQREIEYQTTAG